MYTLKFPDIKPVQCDNIQAANTMSARYDCFTCSTLLLWTKHHPHSPLFRFQEKKNKAVKNLFDALQPFQKQMDNTFFQSDKDIAGVGRNNSSINRKVTLKHANGTILVLQEDVLSSHILSSQLQVFLLDPTLDDTEERLCPYTISEWMHLIFMSHNASVFIPLPI